MASPVTADSSSIPITKRFMRSVWRSLPRTSASFDIGKLITRSILRPEQHQLRVKVNFAGNIPMTLDLSSFVANDLFCMDDHYESVTLQLWKKLAQKARVVLDVGSHIGTFALVAAETNPNAGIVCVEADGNIFQRLKENTDHYPNVTAVNAAIADQVSDMWFCPIGGNDGGGFLSTTQPAESGSYRLHTHTLSGLCEKQNIGPIDLMKLDVEGFEYELLTQNEDFFLKHAPVHLLVELRVDKAAADRSNEIFAAMARRGYRARRIQGLYAMPFGKDHDLANWHFERSK